VLKLSVPHDESRYVSPALERWNGDGAASVAKRAAPAIARLRELLPEYREVVTRACRVLVFPRSAAGEGERDRHRRSRCAQARRIVRAVRGP
jgi:hypothetical protein